MEYGNVMLGLTLGVGAEVLLLSSVTRMDSDLKDSSILPIPCQGAFSASQSSLLFCKQGFEPFFASRLDLILCGWIVVHEK